MGDEPSAEYVPVVGFVQPLHGHALRAAPWSRALEDGLGFWAGVLLRNMAVSRDSEINYPNRDLWQMLGVPCW